MSATHRTTAILFIGLLAASFVHAKSCPNPAAPFERFYWGQGQPSQRIAGSEKHICWLGGVQGKFAGGGEQVDVLERAGFWVLEGNSSQSGVAASAFCIPTDCIPKQRGQVGWTSPRFNLQTNPSGCVDGPVLGLFGDPTCYSGGGASMSMWWGDAFSAITGIGGKFRGGGEKVWIIQAVDGFTPSLLQINSANTDPVFGRSYSFFRGTPHVGEIPKLLPGGNQEFKVNASKGAPQKIVLGPISRVACMLTMVSGKFNGGGERVELWIEGGNWTLRASAAGTSAVSAGARCWQYI